MSTIASAVADMCLRNTTIVLQPYQDNMLCEPDITRCHACVMHLSFSLAFLGGVAPADAVNQIRSTSSTLLRTRFDAITPPSNMHDRRYLEVALAQLVRKFHFPLSLSRPPFGEGVHRAPVASGMGHDAPRHRCYRRGSPHLIRPIRHSSVDLGGGLEVQFGLRHWMKVASLWYQNPQAHR
ncbi:hypothetical protein BV25DRAFT_1045438 [Artomyces pyxidatus]|uniref:Uncharacterized protein n=1 Tax=Artomyces pyxidatus TaxID=48021 RepID=A0ACB8SSY9_9AGAM|nr:hypothetical protein BV25DRAFT_1045438 [Artomyces pyxidatus]